eukprot:9106426-Lingulodinium_polyedra.AAC.1
MVLSEWREIAAARVPSGRWRGFDASAKNGHGHRMAVVLRRLLRARQATARLAKRDKQALYAE